MKTSSSLYSEASGPIGSVEFSRTAAGVTLRNKPVYKAPQTTRQGQNRSAVAAASVAWTGMTPQARESYRLAALRVPIKDKSGNVFYLSGWNFFCRRWIAFTPSFGFFAEEFTLPINLTLPYLPGPVLVEYNPSNIQEPLILRNLSLDAIWVLYFSSGVHSDFRIQTPIYHFQRSLIIRGGGSFNFGLGQFLPGRFYLKFAVIGTNYNWSEIVLRTIDVE